MYFSRSWSLLAALVLTCAQFSSPSRSYADTYQIVFLDSDQNRFFTGMDDLGHVVLNDPGVFCGPQASTCYETFDNGIRVGGFSSTAPNYTWDNGTPCIPSVSSGVSVYHGVCNNGRDAFTGVLSPGQLFGSVYAGSNPPLFLALTAGDSHYGPVYMNALGDIVFDDVFQENWYEAINLDTLPAPEPSSLLLIATGLAGAAFLFLRRRTVA